MRLPSERVLPLRQLLLVTLPTLVLLVALTGVYWWQAFSSADDLRHATVENARLRADQVNDALAETVSMLFFNADEAVQNLAEVYHPTQRSEFAALSKVLTRRFPEGSLLQIAVIGADGYLEYSNLPSQSKVYLGDREHFTVHVEQPQTGLFMSKPLMGKVSKKWTIQFSRRIERQGRFAGVMVLSISPDYLYTTLSRLTQAPRDVLLIMRSSGEIMARNRDMEKSVGVKSAQNQPFDLAKPGQGGHFIARGTVDGIERLYQWQHLRDYPVIVVLGQSMEGLMAPAEKAIALGRNKNIISTVVLWVGAALMLLLTWRMQTHIRRRVEFEHAAMHDMLTGLNNRKALQLRLQQLVDAAQNVPDRHFGLLFIDLDDFKSINDTHGHQAGDHVLQTIADRLRHCARSSDMVARLGGDEFVIVCPDVQHPDHLRKLVDRIRQALAEPIAVGEHDLSRAASIGVAIYPEQGQSVEALLEASDREMYLQKAQHKGQPVLLQPLPAAA